MQDGRLPKSLAVVVGVIALVVCVFYYGVVFLGEVLYSRDILGYFLPVRSFVQSQALGGELPLWNPYEFGGLDLTGNVTQGLFYPLHWLFAPFGAMRGLSLEVVFHHMITAVGVLFLLRRWGVHPMIGAAAGLVMALAGYTTSMGDNVLYLWSFAWIPWAVWATDRMIGARGEGAHPLSSGAALALFLALQFLGGDIQTVYSTALFLGAYVLVFARSRLSSLLLLLGFGALAIGLAGLQVLPAVATLLDSTRAGGLETEMVTQWSLHPARLAELGGLFPTGSLHGGHPFWGQELVNHPTGVPFSYSIYMGVPVLSLAVFSWFVSRRRAIFFGLTGLAWLLLALGEYTPVHGIVHSTLPIWDSFRYPVKSMAIVTFALACLAGLGLEALRRREVKRIGSIVAPAVVCLAVASLLAILVLPVTTETDQVTVWRALGRTALLGVLVIGLIQLSRSRTIAVAALCALVVLDLGSAHLRLVRSADEDLFTGEHPIAEQILAANDPSDGPPRLYRADLVFHRQAEVGPDDQYLAFKVWQQVTLAPSIAQAFGVSYARGQGVTATRQHQALWDALSRDGMRALDLMAVDFLLVPADELGFASNPGFPSLLLSEPLNLRLVAREASVPRLRMVFDARVAPDERRAATALLAPDFDARRSVVLIGGEPAQLESGSWQTNIVEYTPNRVVADVNSDREGWLVMADSYAPGWAVHVDDAPAELLRANLTQRAVRVPAGDHRLVFEYCPEPLKIGLLISGVSGLLWLLLLSAAYIRRRRSPIREQ